MLYGNHSEFHLCIINSRDGKMFNYNLRIYTYKCTHQKCQRRYLFSHERQFAIIDKQVLEIKGPKIFKLAHQGGKIIHDTPFTNQLKGNYIIIIRDILRKNMLRTIRKISEKTRILF